MYILYFMDINQIVNLSSKAWSVKILAALGNGVAGRQAPLIHAVGAGRTAFSASLAHLMELGFLERNPGHGHPLRPEFRLTDQGKKAAEVAQKIVAAVPDEDAFSILRRNWSLPILALTRQPARFSAIRASLPKITDRALSQSLLRLEDQEWLRRDIETSERMPFPTYVAVNTGAQINQVIGVTA